mmetsp:Transcript_17534/g.49319  ORF Transcript_17534/g.49319 Transcript_17534/m.49319 type:complete len:1990 (+) Transcript_17534:83-6052(+)
MDNYETTTFGMFEGDDELRSKAVAFVTKGAAVTAEDLETLNLLPYRMRIRTFAEWARGTREAPEPAALLDAVFASAMLPESGVGPGENTSQDPLLKVFQPQQMRMGMVADKVELYMIGAAVRRSRVHLDKLFVCPSTMFRRGVVSVLLRGDLLSDAEVLALIEGCTDELTLRALVRSAVRFQRVGALTPLYPQVVASQLGRTAAVRLLHAFPGEVVEGHLYHLVTRRPALDAFAEEQRAFWVRHDHQQLRNALDWRRLWKFHAGVVLAVLDRQLRNAGSPVAWGRVWNEWQDAISILTLGLLGKRGPRMVVRPDAARGVTQARHVTARLVTLALEFYPVVNLNHVALPVGERAKVERGHYTLAELFQRNYVTYKELGDPVIKLCSLLHYQDAISKGDLHLERYLAQGEIEAGAVPAAPPLFQLGFMRAILQTALRSPNRAEERTPAVYAKKRKFLERTLDRLLARIPVKEVYLSTVSDPKLSTLAHYVRDTLMPALTCWGSFDAVLDRFHARLRDALPCPLALGLFPTTMDPALWSTIVTENQRTGLLDRWIGYGQSLIAASTTFLNNSVSLLKKRYGGRQVKPDTIAPRVAALQKRYDAVIAVVDTFLDGIDRLTAKDQSVALAEIRHVLRGQGSTWLVTGSTEYVSRLQWALKVPFLPLDQSEEWYRPLAAVRTNYSASNAFERLVVHLRQVLALQLSQAQVKNHIRDVMVRANEGPVTHHDAMVNQELALGRILLGAIRQHTKVPWGDVVANYPTRNLRVLLVTEPSAEQRASGEYAERVREALKLWHDIMVAALPVVPNRSYIKDRPVPSVYSLEVSKFKSFFTTLSPFARGLVLAENGVVADLQKLADWEVAYFQAKPGAGLGFPLSTPQIVLAMPADGAGDLQTYLLDAAAQTFRVFLQRALPKAGSRPSSPSDAASTFLLAMPEPWRIPLLRGLLGGSEEDKNLLSHNAVTSILMKSSIVSQPDPWALEFVRSAASDSVQAVRLEAYSVLYNLVAQQEEPGIYFDNLAFLWKRIELEFGGQKAKQYQFLLSHITGTVSGTTGPRLLELAGAADTSDRFEIFRGLAGGAMGLPDNEAKNAVLGSVSLLSQAMQQAVLGSMESRIQAAVPDGIEGQHTAAGTFTPNELALYALAAEIEWDKVKYVHGDRAAEDKFSLFVRKVYQRLVKEQGLPRAVGSAAADRAATLVRDTYGRYVGEFWVLTGVRAEHLARRLQRMTDLYELGDGQKCRPAWQIEFARGLVAMRRDGRLPDAQLAAVMKVLLELALKHWRKHPRHRQELQEILEFEFTDREDADLPLDERLFYYYVSLSLPFKRGSRQRSGNGARVRRRMTKAERHSYFSAYAKMVKRLLDCSQSAVHVRIVWSFLSRFRQDLLVPFLRDSSTNAFPGPLSTLPRKPTTTEIITRGERAEDDESRKVLLLPIIHDLRKFPQSALAGRRDLLIELIRCRDHPVPRRGRFAFLFGKLPQISLGDDILPLFRTVDPERPNRQALPGPIMEQVLIMSLGSDEPKSPFLFLLSRDVLARTDDRVLQRIVTNCIRVVDPGNNPGAIAAVVAGLTGVVERRAVLSAAIHRTVLRLLMFDVCPRACEILQKHLLEWECPTSVRVAVIQLILDFLGRPSADEDRLWGTLESLVAPEAVGRLTVDEVATLLAVRPGISVKVSSNSDRIVKGRIGEDARSLLQADLMRKTEYLARSLVPFMEKAGPVDISDLAAAQYFHRVLWKLYCAEPAAPPAERTSAWENSVANARLLNEVKLALLLRFRLFLLVPSLQVKIATEYRHLLTSSIPRSEYPESGAVGRSLLPTLREGSGSTPFNVLCSAIAALPYLQVLNPDNVSTCAEPLVQLMGELGTILETTPVVRASTIQRALWYFCFCIEGIEGLTEYSDLVHKRPKNYVHATFDVDTTRTAGATIAPVLALVNSISSSLNISLQWNLDRFTKTCTLLELHTPTADTGNPASAVLPPFRANSGRGGRSGGSRGGYRG